MATLEEVRAQVQHLDSGSRFLGRREIKELPKILWEGETVKRVAQGQYGHRFGLVVATSRRVLFVRKGLFQLRVVDFPYDKISSIQYQTGVIFGQISIFASGNRAEIKNVAKGDARAFAEGVRALISSGGTGSIATKPPDSQGGDRLSALERLSRLRESGALSPEEFAAEKERLLRS